MFELNCGIRLRAFRLPPAGDLDNILGLYNNTQVAPLMTERFIVPRGEKLKDEFKEIIDKNAEMFCIVETIPCSEKSTSGTSDDAEKPSTPLDAPGPQFVGFTALWGHVERGHRRADYSIVLLPEFWSKGYGKAITQFMIDYAFLHLNMHRVSLEVYEGNDKAVSIYKK